MSDPHQPERPAETERRRITVLFADISGFTTLVEQSDSEEAYRVVTGCLKLLDSIARKHGGSVDKYLGDCIMAVFGLPLAIEDAPRAAVNAAIEMLRRTRSFNVEQQLASPLDVHVGINTGLAISGDVSGPVLREFAVMGDPVNIAARLKDESTSGEVFVGEETWRYTRDLFEYAPLGKLGLKGKSQDVRAYRLISRRERLHHARGLAASSIFSDLVGREEVVSDLEDAAAAVREGRGQIRLLLGEAGIGKTRILDEFSRWARGEGFDCLWGSGTTIGQKQAYHLLAETLRQRFEIQDGEEASGRPKLTQAMEAVVPKGDVEGELTVAALMGLPLEEEERARIQKIEGEGMEKVILRTLTELLSRLAERAPLLIVLDDLHWCDAASLTLLERLLRLVERSPILFLLGARDGYPETTGRLLAVLEQDYAAHCSRHDLVPLTRLASRQLLRNLVKHGELPSEFLARIEEKTRGNPFFMEEVVRSLRETGVLVEDERGMHLAGTSESVAIPSSVHDLVMTRIDRLPSACRSVLQGVSVAGETADARVLRSALQEADLDDRLSQLEDSGMLHPVGGGQRWQFRHPLIRQVAYESILRVRREELHLRLARAVEAELSDSVPGFYAMLSYHYGLGKDLERAEEYLVKAGEEATKLAAADEALTLFRDAASIYLTLNPDGGDPNKRADLERNIARAHANRGELTDAIEHINRALRALGERVPESVAARALQALPGVWSVIRLVYMRRRPARHRATDRERSVIDLMFERARAQTTTAPAPRFVFDSLDTFRNVSRVDPASIEGAGGILAGMVGPLTWGGVSFSLSKRFLDLAEPLVDADDHGDCFFFETMRFVHQHQTGDWREEMAIDRELVDESLRLGRLWDVTNYLFCLGERRISCGRWDEAAALVQELHKISELYQYDLARSTYRYVRLLLHLERGEFGAAVQVANDYFTEHQEKLLNVLALGHRAKAEILAGHSDAARQTLEECKSILDTSRMVPPFYRVPHWRSQLLLDVLGLREDPNDQALARRAAGHARRALSAARWAAAREAEVLRLDAERLWLSGYRKRAWRRAEESLAAADRLGARPDLARGHATLARLLERGDPELVVAGRNAAEHRARAEELDAELETFGWAEAGGPHSDPLEHSDLYDPL